MIQHANAFIPAYYEGGDVLMIPGSNHPDPILKFDKVLNIFLENEKYIQSAMLKTYFKAFIDEIKAHREDICQRASVFASAWSHMRQPNAAT